MCVCSLTVDYNTSQIVINVVFWLHILHYTAKQFPHYPHANKFPLRKWQHCSRSLVCNTTAILRISIMFLLHAHAKCTEITQSCSERTTPFPPTPTRNRRPTKMVLFIRLVHQQRETLPTKLEQSFALTCISSQSFFHSIRSFNHKALAFTM